MQSATSRSQTDGRRATSAIPDANHLQAGWVRLCWRALAGTVLADGVQRPSDPRRRRPIPSTRAAGDLDLPGVTEARASFYGWIQRGVTSSGTHRVQPAPSGWSAAANFVVLPSKTWPSSR